MVYNKVLEFFPILRGYIVHLCLANFSCLPNIEYTSDSRAEIHVSAMTLSLMLYSFMMTKFPKRTPHTLYRYPIFYLPKVTKLVSCALCYTILSTCKTEDMVLLRRKSPTDWEAHAETDSHDTNTECVRKHAGRRASYFLIDVSLGSKVRDLLKGPEKEW